MPINRVTIVGNLTRDPELRALPSGGNVCSLRVAVNERRKDASGQWADAPNFFNVTIFGNSADNAAKFLAKGRQVAVDGRLRWREWQDQQGNKRESIEIVAQDVQFIGGREGGGQPGGGGGAGAPVSSRAGSPRRPATTGAEAASRAAASRARERRTRSSRATSVVRPGLGPAAAASRADAAVPAAGGRRAAGAVVRHRLRTTTSRSRVFGGPTSGELPRDVTVSAGRAETWHPFLSC